MTESGLMNANPPMLEDMTWWAYVQKTSRGALNAHIAEAVGVTPSSIGRWGKGSNPDPVQAAAFARAYGRPVLEAFIAAGFLTAVEAGEQPSAAPSLASLSDDDLLSEIRRRMQGGQFDAGNAEAEKMSQDDGEGATITQLPARHEGQRSKAARAVRLEGQEDDNG